MQCQEQHLSKLYEVIYSGIKNISKWNKKYFYKTHRKVRKKRKHTENTVADLSSNASVVTFNINDLNPRHLALHLSKGRSPGMTCGPLPTSPLTP